LQITGKIGNFQYMDDKAAKKIMTGVTKTYNSISREFSDSRAFAGKEFDDFKEYLQPGQTILDLGCGNGRLLQFLEKEAETWHQKTFYYTGVDASKNLLAEAKNKHPDRLFKIGDMTKIPLKDKSVDILFCIRAFHHLPSKKIRGKSLQEMKRVMKSSGVLILTVWNLWQKRYWWQLAKAIARSIVTFGKLSLNDTFIPWGKEKFVRYYHAFTVKELQKLFHESDWNILELSKTQPPGHDIVIIAKP